MGAEAERRFYPGLLPGETSVWRTFLRFHEGDWDRYEYNVFVGEGVTPPPETFAVRDALSERIAAWYRGTTRKKLDVLAWRGAVAWIIEVEERASTTALGQLLTYRALLPASRSDVGATELAVVCRTLAPDMLPLFEELGAFVWQVG